MKILITNDDGMHAEELVPLIKWCRKLGDVTAFVPKYEQSGKSHSIELHRAFEAKQVELEPGVTVWAVDSSPADCIRFAVLGLKQEFDLVISGVNKGLNIGADIMYSGTVGAVFEANALGLPAIALSTQPKYYHQAISHLDAVFDFLQEHRLMHLWNSYNINIPAAPKGIRITHQGGPYYTDDFEPMGNDLYLPKGRSIWEDRQDLCLDTDAALHGYISIMPLTTNRTAQDVYDRLAHLILFSN